MKLTYTWLLMAGLFWTITEGMPRQNKNAPGKEKHSIESYTGLLQTKHEEVSS